MYAILNLMSHCCRTINAFEAHYISRISSQCGSVKVAKLERSLTPESFQCRNVDGFGMKTVCSLANAFDILDVQAQ